MNGFIGKSFSLMPFQAWNLIQSDYGLCQLNNAYIYVLCLPINYCLVCSCVVVVVCLFVSVCLALFSVNYASLCPVNCILFCLMSSSMSMYIALCCSGLLPLASMWCLVTIVSLFVFFMVLSMCICIYMSLSTFWCICTCVKWPCNIIREIITLLNSHIILISIGWHWWPIQSILVWYAGYSSGIFQHYLPTVVIYIV